MNNGRIERLKKVEATTLSEKQIQTNKERFIQIFNDNIIRKGSDELLKYLESSDFFYSPASTKYHMSCKGGLCAHLMCMMHSQLNSVKNSLKKSII